MKVKHEVALTNKLSNVYAHEYSFTIEGMPPSEIYAWDDLGEIEYQAFIQPETTRIALPFNQEVVGKDKTLNFGLSYFKNDLIEKTGDVWEIIVPKFANFEQAENLSLQLEIPNEFGHVAFISPSPVSQSIEGGYQIFKFTKEQISHSGVVAAFGEFQTFKFEATYHLENSENKKIITEIALPPDTSYQKIYYQVIEPEPENVEVDSSGNWLAQYRLDPHQELEIKAKGMVKVFAKPYQLFTKPDNLEVFLQPTRYWPVDEELVKEKVEDLKTVEQIYKFVVNSLTYDYSRVREGAKRLGAVDVLAEPEKATCMEFTDLFITLARAAGIPAREINGFAYTTNPQLKPLSFVQDVLHAWPEYWDEASGLWVQVDPTWQNTTGGVDYFNKLDLDHFAFVIHGEEDSYPFPAGAYKVPGEYSKDVLVEFGKFQEAEPEEKIELIFDLPDLLASELKTKGNLKLFNLSPMAIYNFSTTIETKGINAILAEDDNLVLPPFAYKSMPIELSSSRFFETGPAMITLKINNQVFEKPFRVESLLLRGIIFIFASVSLSLSVLYVYLRIRRRKKIDSPEEVC